MFTGYVGLIDNTEDNYDVIDYASKITEVVFNKSAVVETSGYCREGLVTSMNGALFYIKDIHRTMPIFKLSWDNNHLLPDLAIEFNKLVSKHPDVSMVDAFEVQNNYLYFKHGGYCSPPLVSTIALLLKCLGNTFKEEHYQSYAADMMGDVVEWDFEFGEDAIYTAYFLYHIKDIYHGWHVGRMSSGPASFIYEREGNNIGRVIEFIDKFSDDIKFILHDYDTSLSPLWNYIIAKEDLL